MVFVTTLEDTLKVLEIFRLTDLHFIKVFFTLFSRVLRTVVKELSDVAERSNRRGQVSEMGTGKNVRYVHIPDHMDIGDTIQTQLDKIHCVRTFAHKGGRKEFRKKK
uniref:Uncharacterized protein n=1 Tax=Astyanax mexicanus TaxID=7994 RepID=A0A8B9RNJ3_ASTMX